MKVLFFSHQAEFIYGGEIVTREFLRELAARGVEAHFASPAGPYHERVRELGVRTHLVGSVQFRRELRQLPGLALALPRTAGELAAIRRREAIDLVHATSLKAMAYCWGAGGAVLWHHHDILPPGPVNSLWLRGLAARARRILAPSGATRAALLAAGVSAEKAHVLRNGFRTDEWAARPPQKPNHLFRIGVVGEISRRKGTDRLEAILRELGEDPLIQVLVIGEGLSEPEFADGLEKKLASRRVRFLGRRTRMKELYHEMDVLLVPSRQDPLPTVIVEAGLSGVPVVGARAGGIPEMIDEGRNGFLFDTEAEAARAILRVRDGWGPLSRGSREVALQRYDVRKLTGDLIGHYDEVLRGS